MKKEKVSKQVIGIDVSKDSFYACYKVQYDNVTVTIKGTKSFDNNNSGMKKFQDWYQKRNKTPEIVPLFIMEATGVYYEELAYFLNKNKQLVSVQLAQKVKHFAKGCNINTKTDKVDSKVIAQFGIEKNLSGTDIWTPPSEDFKKIRDLTREHTNLKQAQTAAKQQLHALKIAHESNPEVIEMKRVQISFYEEQIKLVEKEMRKLVKADKELQEKVKKIESIKGVGFITIMKVLTEVNGFALIKNIRQLVSYAGLDVIEKSSGKFTGKTKISKKGNAHLRTALFMPAMNAIQKNNNLKRFYERVNENRRVKKQGLVAVMRKILILIYTLWKKDQEYIENYINIKTNFG